MSEVGHEAHEEQIAGTKSREENSTREPQRGLAPPPGRPRNEPVSSLQRTASALRATVPLIQKLLPLLDGNVAATVANLVAPRLLSGPTVDLSPIEASLMKLRGELAAIQDRHAQQDVAFRRIDDRLETMKEAVEHTAIEQRDVAEGLEKVRRNVLIVSVVGLSLLVASIGLNVAVFLFIKGYFR